MVVELKAQLTRRELYEKIWASSLVQVGREIRISAGTLRTICRDHSIPVPPKGFNLKDAPKSQTPLPELSGWNPNIIDLFGQAESRRRLQHCKPADMPDIPEIIVSRDGRLSHPFTIRTRHLLAR